MRLRDVARCDRCAFWSDPECRKRAPTSELALSTFYRDPDRTVLWPETSPGSWCGEFVADEVGDGASA